MRCDRAKQPPAKGDLKPMLVDIGYTKSFDEFINEI
jgi:hypothetical protein